MVFNFFKNNCFLIFYYCFTIIFIHLQSSKIIKYEKIKHFKNYNYHTRLYELYAFVASCNYIQRNDCENGEKTNDHSKCELMKARNYLTQLSKSTRLHGNTQRRSRVVDEQG